MHVLYRAIKCTAVFLLSMLLSLMADGAAIYIGTADNLLIRLTLTDALHP